MTSPDEGQLVQRYVNGPEAAALRERARSLPRVSLSARQLSDAHMISQGAFSPIEGFMSSNDYGEVVRHMHLADGLPWSLPLTLAVDKDVASGLPEGGELCLSGPGGAPVGTLDLQEVFEYAKETEAEEVYRTTDESHPGVAQLYAQGDVLLGGKVTLFEEAPVDPQVAAHYRTPAQARQAIKDRGWSSVVGFQTRNPVHRAHEYIQKCALEIVDGLLLHPLVGETKSDDIPASVRMRCYEALLDTYYPGDRVLLSVFPAFMRYAGPREAVFHALVRKNYGCTHFIVGRDHAGVGNYYGPYDAQHIFREFDPSTLGIAPMFFENAFFCRQCEGMTTSKTCPHDSRHRVELSGTQVRKTLLQGQAPPPEFTRPEVARVLMEAAANNGAGQTGHPNEPMPQISGPALAGSGETVQEH